VLIVVAALPKIKEEEIEAPRPSNNPFAPTTEPPSGGPAPAEKICPRCAETIKAAAVVCRFCGNEFDPAEVSQSPRDGGQSQDPDAPTERRRGERREPTL